MTLEQILKQIEALRPHSEEDVDSGPCETLSARRGRKRQAQEKIKLLTEQYTQQFMKTVVFMVPVGSKKEEFGAAIRKQLPQCFMTDMVNFYKDLTARVHPTIYKGKQSGSALFDVIGRHLEDMAMDLNILEMPQLVFKNKYLRVIKDEADLLDIVKRAVNEQIGGEIATIYASRKISQEALKRRHGGPVSLVMFGSDDELLTAEVLKDAGRFTPNVFEVVAGKLKANSPVKPGKKAVGIKEFDEKNLEDLLTAIQNKVTILR